MIDVMCFRFARSAALAVALFLVCLPAMAQDAAGVIERQKGEATRSLAGSTVPLSLGTKVFAGDVLKTGPEARLLVRFADGSSLTLGEKAEVFVDEMVFDPAAAGAGAGRQALIMVVGVFRYTSGKIGKTSPSQVAFGTPTATIGIRGTDFVGGELTVGMPAGQPHYGFQIQEGAIEVITPQGSVTLDDPGEGTFLPLAGGRAPTPVRQWTAEEAAEAQAAIAF
ncbi:FecR domain-containing protein [Thalassospiraceae bacterium LMO-SO8]|nr:FecR family protein [Alphaproteobacteria bacterium LMO-S08]WND75016.1 FecR domain-containing protein [Thalassospiraceae bacterium LMO-SO8]